MVSATKSRADDFSTFTLRLIHDMDILQHLIPRPDQRASKVSFDVGPARPDHSPSVKSVSIFGQLAGSRADEIIPDDVEVMNNSVTQTARDRLAEAIKEFDAILKPGGRTSFLGTPQTENSLYSVLETRGYVIRIWPARYPDEKAKDRYGHRLAPMIADSDQAAGEPTEPKRFSKEDLLEREASYGRQGFALQFQLDTSLSDMDRYPLKIGDFITYPLDPSRGPTDLVWASGPNQIINELPNVALSGDRFHRPAWSSEAFAPYESAVMFIDPSGRGKDETAYAVVKVLHGRLFLAASGGFLNGYDEETVLKPLFSIARLHSVSLILAEPNYGGGMFTSLLKGASTRYYPCTIRDSDWSKGQKEQRIIDTLEPVLLQHRLVIDPAVVERDYKSVESYGANGPQYRLMHQLTRLTRDRGALAHDDRIEALAGAVAHWEKQLARSTTQALNDHQEAEKDKKLEKFLNHIIGKGKSERPWFSDHMRNYGSGNGRGHL